MLNCELRGSGSEQTRLSVNSRPQGSFVVISCVDNISARSPGRETARLLPIYEVSVYTLLIVISTRCGTIFLIS